MEDYNIPSTERVALLQRLQEAVGDVPPYFWAACQICDLKILEKLVECACILPELVCLVADQTRSMILHWTQSPKGSSRTPSQATTPTKQTLSDLGSSPASSPLAKRQKTTDSPGSKVATSPVLSRNPQVKNLAKQRDRFLCVLTGDALVEVAHIYPFYSLKNKEGDTPRLRHNFWNYLKIFWPKEKVAAWAEEVFPQGTSEIGVERVYNLITLSRTAHGYWNRGAFALKPISISDDNTTLKVQFFWQRKTNNTGATMSLLTTPFPTKDLDHNEGAFDVAGDTVLFNARKCIKSGDIFELKTDDVEARPLPSFKLLEVQWFLTRIVGMAGAAAPYDEAWGDSDSEDAAVLYEAGWGDEVADGEISNPGLDYARDASPSTF